MERDDLEHQDAEGSSSCAAEREGVEEGIGSTAIELRQLFEEQLANSQTSDRRVPGVMSAWPPGVDHVGSLLLSLTCNTANRNGGDMATGPLADDRGGPSIPTHAHGEVKLDDFDEAHKSMRGSSPPTDTETEEGPDAMENGKPARSQPAAEVVPNMTRLARYLWSPEHNVSDDESGDTGRETSEDSSDGHSDDEDEGRMGGFMSEDCANDHVLCPRFNH